MYMKIEMLYSLKFKETLFFFYLTPENVYDIIPSGCNCALWYGRSGRKMILPFCRYILEIYFQQNNDLKTAVLIPVTGIVKEGWLYKARF